MQQFKSALIVEYGFMRLLLFKKHNGVFTYFNEQKVDYDGFTESGFASPDDVFYKIQKLYSDAENYGAIEKNALVVLPGIFFKYGIDEKEANIPGGTVGSSDVRSLLNACNVPLPSYVAVQKRALNFKTLQNPAVTNPIGEKTDVLRVTASVEYLKLNIKEMFDNCEKRLGKVFDCTSFGGMAALCEKSSRTAEKIIIILADGNIDVVLACGSAPVAVRSDLLGSRHIAYSLAEELKCADDIAEEIMLGSNLNLNFTDTDKYFFGNEKYSVETVNTCLAEALIYIAGGVKKCIDDLNTDTKILFLTGSDVCAVRGVKDIFEDETACEVNVLSADALNLKGCGDYVAAAIETFIRQKDEKKKMKSKFKSLFGRN